MLVGFLVFIFCTVAFSADYYSIVQVDNKATPDTVLKKGDTLTIKADLAAGEHFLNWTIESGSGDFLYSYTPTTKFVPTSSNVVLKKNTTTNAYSYKTLSDKFVGYYDYDEAFYTPNAYYGVAGKYKTSEAGVYSVTVTFKGSIQYPKYAKDSLFSSATSLKYDNIRFSFTADANTTYYLQFRHADFRDTKDSLRIRIDKARMLKLSTQGLGSATLDSAKVKVSSYSKFLSGDSVTITAAPDTNYNFSKWTKVSGTCTIDDLKSPSTTVVMGKSDCNIQAEFVPGVYYPVTQTPVEYSVAEHLFSTNEKGKSNEVRFIFDPQTTGKYIVYTSTIPLTDTTLGVDSLKYERAVDKSFAKFYRLRNFYGTYIDTISYTAGTPVYLAAKWISNKISDHPFWISYAPLSDATYSLKISSDAQGSVKPSTPYTNVNTGAKLSIGAIANQGFRFQRWQIVSGSVTFDDLYAPFTYATLKSNAEVKAIYQGNSIYPLSFTEQTFNYRNNYYSESTGPEIRFTWTPPEPGYYAITFLPVDSISATLSEYETDSTFTTAAGQLSKKDTISVLIKSVSTKPLFWSIKDSSNIIQSKSFKAKIQNAYTLEVSSDNNGSTYPNGTSYAAPFASTIITAWPYGGYTFSSWTKLKGNYDIADNKKFNTVITPLDSFVSIKANFTIDLTAQPCITIDNLDLGNYPGVCAQVSVTDQNNRSINGLSNKDFILFEDNASLSAQVSSIKEVSAISTVLVVDQSGSMTFNRRMDKSKDALRNFVKDMGAFDRAAIVGFFGGDSTHVHQEMTSDTSLLLSAINTLKGGGETNIFGGTYTGIQQAINEINPTAIIVFSDGENGIESIKLDSVINTARKQNVSIYTIGLETTAEHPLKDLADSTGGTFTFASDASELAGIYASIRDNMQSKYIICYQTPDTLLNGDTHEIKISASLLGKNTSATIQWQESFMPPTITITDETWNKILNTQPTNVAIPIQVYITSAAPITTANINIRPTSRMNKTFQTISLKHVRDSLWEYVLPADSALSPGIDFYITVIDSMGFIGKSPKIPSPSKEPYTIAIENDLPRISFVSAICADSTKGKKTFTFRIADDNGIAKASLYYKESEDILFKEVSLYHKSIADSTWYISLPSDAATSSGLDFYIRAYDTMGANARWEKVGYSSTDACFVKGALQDIDDAISISNADTTEPAITRTTENIMISVMTEDFSDGPDTIIINLRCLESGDIENVVSLYETTSGFYNGTVPKNEFLPKRDDGTISCTGNDTLVAIYKDPAFGTFVFDTVVIGSYVPITYQFLEISQDNDLDSVETNTQADFRLRVTTTSEKLHVRDTVTVTLFSTSGDTLQVKAIETDTNSAIFDYTGKFHFVQDSSELDKKRLEGILDFTTSHNREKVQAQVGKDTSSLSKRDSLIIFTNYVPADTAEIYDKNLDGEADFVRIHFMKPLEKNIESVDTLFWNVGHENPYYVSKQSVKMTNDKSWLEIKLDSTFEYGKTGIQDSSKLPYLRLTKTSSDLSQKVLFTDKVGAVPTKAVKHPGKIAIEDYLSTHAEVPPDTLMVTLSERISRIGDENAWKDLFYYSKTCKDTAIKPLRIKKKPQVLENGLFWTIILEDYAILTNNCLRINPKAEYTDLVGNSLGRGGVPITGNDGSLHLYEVKANPSVTGIGQKAEWIPPKGKDFEEVPDTISTIRFTSVARFKADIFIYDGSGAFVNNLHQKFGYNGELEDEKRGNSSKREKLGYLYWNQRSNKGRKVGSGVYIWKIIFTFEDDDFVETITLKTGIRRPPNEK